MTHTPRPLTITVEIENQADPEAWAMALACIALRLARAYGAPVPEATAAFALIYASARIAHPALAPTEPDLVRALTKAAKFSARVVCARDPDADAAQPGWDKAMH